MIRQNGIENGVCEIKVLFPMIILRLTTRPNSRKKSKCLGTLRDVSHTDNWPARVAPGVLKVCRCGIDLYYNHNAYSTLR